MHIQCTITREVVEGCLGRFELFAPGRLCGAHDTLFVGICSWLILATALRLDSKWFSVVAVKDLTLRCHYVTHATKYQAFPC